MLHTDARFSEAVETAIGRLETRTDAEIVVVAAPRSGSYLDISVLAGAVGSWLALVLLLFSPWSFSPVWIPVELPILGVFLGWLTHRRPGLLRLVTGRARQQAQVNNAADAVFHREVVHGTRGRTGLLIYLSTLEDRVVLRTDLGLDARVPGAAWNGLHWTDGKTANRVGDLAHFLRGLDAVGDILAEFVPATDDNPNEIPDAPRILS